MFWLLAATDGHAKNFSIAHLPAGLYRSTPLYDVLSAHPIIGSGRNQIARQKAKLAMAVRSSTNHYLIDKIQAHHWIAQARQAELGDGVAADIMKETLDSTDKIIKSTSAQLPADFPDELADVILTGLKKQSDRLAAMLSKMPS